MSARRCFLSRVIRLNTRKTRSGTFGGLWNTLSTMKLPRNNSSTRIEDEPPSARALRRQILSSKSSLREFCSPKAFFGRRRRCAVMLRRLKRAYILLPSSRSGKLKSLHSVTHHRERERMTTALRFSSSSSRCSLLLFFFEAVSKAVSEEARRFSVFSRERKRKNRCAQSRQGG